MKSGDYSPRVGDLECDYIPRHLCAGIAGIWRIWCRWVELRPLSRCRPTRWGVVHGMHEPTTAASAFPSKGKLIIGSHFWLKRFGIIKIKCPCWFVVENLWKSWARSNEFSPAPNALTTQQTDPARVLFKQVEHCFFLDSFVQTYH